MITNTIVTHSSTYQPSSLTEKMDSLQFEGEKQQS